MATNIAVVIVIIFIALLLIAGSCVLCQRMYVSSLSTHRKLSHRISVNSQVLPARQTTSRQTPSGQTAQGYSIYTIPVQDAAGNSSHIVVQTCPSRTIFIEPLCEEPPPSYEDCMRTKPINYTGGPIIHV